MQRKCYIIVVTQALVVCLICPPSALGPAALGLRVYISGRPLVPVLQLLLRKYFVVDKKSKSTVYQLIGCIAVFY